MMKEISISKIDGFRIGHAQDLQAMTGCTVVLCEQGGVAGLDVRGGGPASRESELLKPLSAAEKIHAVLLSGGSAFGLDAAGGVMRFCYERKIGFETGFLKVPLVCASCIYDFQIGASDVWPDAAMGYLACQNAMTDHEWIDGNVGVGTGATVGKLFGPKRMMKSGLGAYAVQSGELKVGAIVAVNALGDVFDPQSGEQLAGLLNTKRTKFISSERKLNQKIELRDGWSVQNTTLAIILCNAAFSKVQMNKIASMANNGLARTIRPLNTSMDGDAIYAMSFGELSIHADIVGSLAAHTVAMAVKRATLSAVGTHTILSSSDFMRLNH